MQVTRDASEQVLILAGSLDIRVVEKTRAALLEYLQADLNPVIDLSQITDCDTPGLQLIFSAKQTAERLGKPFSFVAVSEAIRMAIEDLGLSFLDTPLLGETPHAA